MTPAQVCVLLAALLGGSSGATLARAAPAPATAAAPGRALHKMIADRLGASAAASEAPPTPQPGWATGPDDYYVYEYEDYMLDDYTDRAPAAAAESSPADGADGVAEPGSGRRPGDGDASEARPVLAASTPEHEAGGQAELPGRAADGAAAKTTPTTSTTTATPSPTTAATAETTEPTSVTRSGARVYSKFTPDAKNGFPGMTIEIPSNRLEANDIDFEQQASGSDKVLAYEMRAANLEAPGRETPQFFVPPIVRRPYRRGVSLSGGGRRRNEPRLGDLLAEQVRKQLAHLQQEESETLGLGAPQSAAPPAAYKHPFIPSPPTTTDRPYRHPFIPSPPTTTSEPYKHPFIPSPPTTTAEPYKHPFIPVPPETTRDPPPAPAAPQGRRVPDGRPPRPPPATIVHEETLEAGFIVGEYGEVRGGGTVRGVKYAADSSVDRRLLEQALAQFLRL